MANCKRADRLIFYLFNNLPRMPKTLPKIALCFVTWFLFLFFFTGSSLAAWGPNEAAKLLASDGASGDMFGFPVSISGDTVIVGAMADSGSGSAYIFTRNGNTWTQHTKLLASDGESDDYFGISVSISGDTAIVGAVLDDDNGSNSGSAYIFTRNGSAWTQQAKLLAADGAMFNGFGFSVSVSGDTAIVGAAQDDDNGSVSGSAYIFTRNGSTWTQQAKLLAADGESNDLFGHSIAISGDTAIVASPKDDDNGPDSGSAYVFTRNGNSWTQQAKLSAADGESNDFFGYSVSVSGNTAIVGAHMDDDNGSISGSAYIFTRNGSTWTQQAKLLAADGVSDDYFGTSVSISGDTAIVGAPDDDDNGSMSGSAYVFTRSGSVWTQQAKLLPSDGESNDYFGRFVSVSGNAAAVGAPFDNVNGSAYVFNDASAITIPTLNDWGVIIMAMLLMGASFRMMKRRPGKI